MTAMVEATDVKANEVEANEVEAKVGLMASLLVKFDMRFVDMAAIIVDEMFVVDISGLKVDKVVDEVVFVADFIDVELNEDSVLILDCCFTDVVSLRRSIQNADFESRLPPQARWYLMTPLDPNDLSTLLDVIAITISLMENGSSSEIENFSSM